MDSLKQSGRFELNDAELSLLRALFAAERVDEAQTIEVMQDFGRRHACRLTRTARSAWCGAPCHIARWRANGDAGYGASGEISAAIEKAYDSAPDTPARVHDMLAKPERFTPVANELHAVEQLIRAGTGHGA